MRNNWLFPMDLDGWSPYMFPVEPLVHPHLLSHISSFVDNSLYHSKCFYVSGSMALQDAFNCMSKFTGALLLWFATGPNSNFNHNLPGDSLGFSTRNCKSCAQANHITSAGRKLSRFGCTSRLKGESLIPVIFHKISKFSVRQMCKQAEQLQSFPMLSLAAVLIPPFDKVSQNVLAVPLDNDNVLLQRTMDRSPCEVEHRGCGDLYFSNFGSTRHAVEPRTGIEFPIILDNIIAGEASSNWLSEVLVGTGSRTMKIIKIKSLKVYAFGFYVHPYDVCEKLGPKYASIPASELNKHHSFYQDLLREDISMTVRLVVSVNGMKISTVKNALEKSLQARLMKTNPNADYDCLRRFGSLFSEDIPIRAGTTIYFKRTADGHLITEGVICKVLKTKCCISVIFLSLEIPVHKFKVVYLSAVGGNQIGAVHSKDLCRAFFDMYIGDFPVCKQTKEEIGRNVASIIGRC